MTTTFYGVVLRQKERSVLHLPQSEQNIKATEDIMELARDQLDPSLGSPTVGMIVLNLNHSHYHWPLRRPRLCLQIQSSWLLQPRG